MEGVATHVLLSLLVIIILSLLLSKRFGIADVLFYLIGGFIAVNSGVLSAESPIIETFAFIGTIFLFFYLGLEENLQGFQKGVKKGWKIAIAGVILPFVAIFGVMYWMTHDTIKAMIFGMAFAPTSIGIAFLTLNTLSFRAKNTLQPIIVAAAITDDVLSLVLWGVLGGILLSLHESVAGVSFDMLVTLATPPILHFLFLMLTMSLIGYWFFHHHPTSKLNNTSGIPKFLLQVKNFSYRHTGANAFLGEQEENAVIVSLIFLAFMGAYLAQIYETSIALGAYAIGLIVNHEHFDNRHNPSAHSSEEAFHRATEKFKFLTLYFFAPIFFISIGLHMQIHDWGSIGGVIVQSLGIALVVFVAQFVAAAAVAHYVDRLPWRSASLIGIAMQGRAEVTFLVAIAAYGMDLVSDADVLLISLSAFVLNLSVPFALQAAARYHERCDQALQQGEHDAC